jgi:hypothetical protein
VGTNSTRKQRTKKSGGIMAILADQGKNKKKGTAPDSPATGVKKTNQATQPATTEAKSKSTKKK